MPLSLTVFCSLRRLHMSPPVLWVVAALFSFAVVYVLWGGHIFFRLWLVRLEHFGGWGWQHFCIISSGGVCDRFRLSAQLVWCCDIITLCGPGVVFSVQGGGGHRSWWGGVFGGVVSVPSHHSCLSLVIAVVLGP